MLTLENISLFVGRKLLLNEANFSINRGDKIGIVGRNGTGKSHLMSLLDGAVTPDSGARKLVGHPTILLVKQELPDDYQTPLEYLRINDPDILALETMLENSGEDKFGDIATQLAILDEERYETLAPKILIGLGLTTAELTQPMRTLSGGLRMRIGLAQALVRMPDILLLDEPTNHLDLESTQWLIEFLKQYSTSAAFVIVTHDLKLLREVCTSTIHLRGGVLIQFSGNYDQYRQQLETATSNAIESNNVLEKKIARKTEIYYKFRDLPESRAAQAVKQLRDADKLKGKLVEIIQEEPVIALSFVEPAIIPDPVILLHNVSVSYDTKTILQNLELSIQYGAKIGILGRNGEGKSTLVRLIADKLKEKTGTVERGLRLKIGYFSQELTEELDTTLTVHQQFTERTGISNDAQIRTTLGHYGFSHDKINLLIGNLSGGEKSRLLFALICATAPNLIILDEPTNHLDVETRNELVKAIINFSGSILLVSHDWRLHEQTMNQFWIARDNTVQTYPKGLKQYQLELQQFIEINLLSHNIASLSLDNKKQNSQTAKNSQSSSENKATNKTKNKIIVEKPVSDTKNISALRNTSVFCLKTTNNKEKNNIKKNNSTSKNSI